MIEFNSKDLGKVFNKINEVQRKSDKRYKIYQEYIDDIEELQADYKKAARINWIFNIMFLSNFIISIVILRKVL